MIVGTPDNWKKHFYFKGMKWGLFFGLISIFEQFGVIFK